MNKLFNKIFYPELFKVLLNGYGWASLVKDIMAGVVVAVVALPLSVAFAIASGVRPEQGIATAVVAGFLISLFGGSRVQIGGPTGAFIVIILGIVNQYGYDGLAIATLMAGVILIAMGVAGLGNVIKYIPYPVTVGFTSGIALLIFTTQVKDFLGLTGFGIPSDFLDKWGAYALHISQVHWGAVATGMSAVFIICLWPKKWIYCPGYLVAIVGVTLAVHWMGVPVELISDRFTIKAEFFEFHSMDLSLGRMRELLLPALTIAFLGGVESLLSAVVADGMIQQRHNSNTELIAQGIANIASPLFGGIPATGAIARTATNIKLGAVSPISGIVHSIGVLIIFLFCAPLIGMVPMAVLAGLLMIVAYHMSEWRLFLKLFRGPRSDVLVLLVTFTLTVLVDLTRAIEVGMVCAAFLFMRRMGDVTQIGLNEEVDDERDGKSMPLVVPKDVQVFEIYGPFFFGAADKFRNTVRGIGSRPKALILRMRHVPAVDATGLSALEDLYDRCRKDKITLILSGVQNQPKRMLERYGLLEKIGPENVCAHIDHALFQAMCLFEK